MNDLIASGSAAIRFATFPQTKSPPPFAYDIVQTFQRHISEISTVNGENGPTSDALLALVSSELMNLGFEVEKSKRAADKIARPVFFGENGRPELQYNIDAWHPEWQAGLEIEAGRALQGNAVYRDLIQAMVMVDMENLILVVPQMYRFGERNAINYAYRDTTAVAKALYGHSRIRMPFDLCVIGY